MEIKGEKQFIDLFSSAEFFLSRFDELERERKGKNELMNSLQIEVSFLKLKVKNLEKMRMIRRNTRVRIAC